LFFRASCCLSRTCLDADAAGREAIEKMLQLSERLNFPRTTAPFDQASVGWVEQSETHHL
jgi:hypothetical protein